MGAAPRALVLFSLLASNARATADTDADKPVVVLQGDEVSLLQASLNLQGGDLRTEADHSILFQQTMTAPHKKPAGNLPLHQAHQQSAASGKTSGYELIGGLGPKKFTSLLDSEFLRRVHEAAEAHVHQGKGLSTTRSSASRRPLITSG
mmetsp:Transcript_16700/g.43124  ORF Transcript_16700/g.43124 Transcript_16700/m.43124 type:complete len:149 (+) Transcript_16700:61-507(+)